MVAGRYESRIMLELIRNFERIAMRFSTPVLVIPGLILVLVGLFIWLGGLGFGRILSLVLGAVAGGLLGLFLIGKTFAAAALLALVAAIVAMIFKKLFITILTAALAAIVTFALLNASNLEQYDSTSPAGYPAAGRTISVSQSLRAVTDFAADFFDAIKYSCSKMTTYNWAIIVAAFVLLLVAGFFLWRFTSALGCAFMGTLCIFIGIILLLIFKGSLPITALCSKSPFYLSVFAAMIVFGTLEQLLLCKTKQPKQKIEKDQQKVKRKDWRTV